MKAQLLLFCIIIALLSTITGSLPVKQWPTAPNRQPHLTGLQYPYLPTKASTFTAQYKKFFEAKASGELPPQATFRPDSWSQYNFHLEKRDMEPEEPEEMGYLGIKALDLVFAQENTTVCNISETPNHYCPKTSEQLARELGEARRGLFSGTTLGVIFAIGMAFTYFLSHHFVRYFEYKERWHVERARLRTIRRVNREMVKRGLDNTYHENSDQWLLDHPPSLFWATIFESETFIALLYFIERRTASVGKFTGMMKRPKLGDEASGIPLNSPRARRRYRKTWRRTPIRVKFLEAPESESESQVTPDTVQTHGETSDAAPTGPLKFFQCPMVLVNLPGGLKSIRVLSRALRKKLSARGFYTPRTNAKRLDYIFIDKAV
ncbi:hypothetical protein TWF102_002832 [Orbilia oligospora]|uniref:Uncharacterized protein n=1 Tax=Orbilia oligospora TaxID=2813651 RepID=A0A7C8J478_ORBOL|nr:hypothetical protein TWF102_002832 [Orbilia oligospora]KAF3116308.1 hypothetical protein TWF706_003957 [Orbilia oligospora]